MTFVTTLLTASLSAQEKLTPANLGAWSSRGAAPIVNAGQDTVAVPAGGEISRFFTTTQVAVHLTTRPFFSPAVTGLPTLQVGPAILTFTRDHSGGAMVLLGDQRLALPFTIALDGDNRSRQPLDFTLNYDQPKATAGLKLGGQTYTLAATALDGPVEVVVTAGATAPWTLDTLEVATVADDQSADPSATSAAGTASTGAPKKQTLADAASRRAKLAAAVVSGELTAAEALARLRKMARSNLKIDAEADFALGAIEIGEILIGYTKFDEAEVFFRAAEPALVVARNRSARSAEQALCLKKLAWIRSRYLQQQPQAKLDIEAAQRLYPADKNLRRLHARLTGQKSKR